jgi:hypothetical protein
MSPSRLIRTTVLAAAMASSGIAAAGGPTHPQTHHCKMPDGTMDMKKTHKQCTAAKGTWAKDAPKDPPKAGATPAPTPTPTPAPTAPATPPKK